MGPFPNLWRSFRRSVAVTSKVFTTPLIPLPPMLFLPEYMIGLTHRQAAMLFFGKLCPHLQFPGLSASNILLLSMNEGLVLPWSKERNNEGFWPDKFSRISADPWSRPRANLVSNGCRTLWCCWFMVDFAQCLYKLSRELSTFWPRSYNECSERFFNNFELS